jgi:probable HAF family extracellular repeat protein
MHDLGAMGGVASGGASINDHGQITGSINYATGLSHGFLYDPVLGMLDLETLIDPLSGWRIVGGVGINNAGQIAANGYNQSGVLRALLLTPNLAGDFNGNGTVDAADYVAWRNGDSPDDSQAGYNLWKANFGRSAGSGTSSITVAASRSAPEPSTLPLVAGSLWVGLMMCRRHRRWNAFHCF